MHQPHHHIPRFLFLTAGIVLAMLPACRQSVKHQPKASLKIQPAYKVFPLDETDGSPMSDKMHNPEVMYNCPVYTQPDTSSKQITTLSVLTPLHIKGRVERYYQDTAKAEGRSAYLTNGSRIWYQIQTDHQQGFISEAYVAKFTFADIVHKAAYLFGEAVLADTVGFVRSVLKYDTQHQQLLSKVNVPANNSGNFKVIEQKNNVLKAVSHLFRIDEDMEYSGGSQTAQLIADGSVGLVAFPQTNVGYDDGEGIRQNVLYVPAKGKDGVLKFYIDGDIDNHLQWTSFSVPAWNAYNIPADQILMLTTWRGQKQLDKNNQPVVEKGKDQKFKSMVKRSVFYKWDGKEIKEVGRENW